MKMLAVNLLLLTSPWLAGQSTNSSGSYRYNGNGYVFASVGACHHGYLLFGGGGGGEALLWKGLTVGAEGGAYTFSDGYAFASVQPTVGCHFVNRKVRAKNEYFVNFGPGAVFGVGSGGAGPWASLGGGGIRWLNDKVGIRIEARMQAFSDEGMIVGRIGVSFR
jgi:hypothetical protein